MGCVYRILCKTNGKSYVGQTTQHDTPDARWVRHQRYALHYGSQLPFHAAIRYHGAYSFTVETLFQHKSPYVLNKLEAFWAEEFNSYLWGPRDGEYPPGYNACLAGVPNRMLGVKHTPAAREKIRQANIRRWASWRKAEL
jgi:hypothetical protein